MDREDARSVAAVGKQGPGGLGFDRDLVEEAIGLAEFWAIGEVLTMLGPPPVDVAEKVARNEKHGGQDTGSDHMLMSGGGTLCIWNRDGCQRVSGGRCPMTSSGP